MSTNLEYRAKVTQRKRESIGRRPAKLNEKKGDRDLDREIKNRGDIFCWKNNMKILLNCDIGLWGVKGLTFFDERPR